MKLAALLASLLPFALPFVPSLSVPAADNGDINAAPDRPAEFADALERYMRGYGAARSARH